MSDIVFGILIAFIVICLVILFCVILIKLYISKIKTYNQILFQKKIEQQKVLNQTIIETQDTTLNNIAKELHDDAGQQLTYINFQLENVKLKHPNFKKTIEPVSHSINELSNTLRTLSHNINNQKIKDSTLLKSIQNELDRLNKLETISCNLTVEKDFDYNFTDNETIVLYRIFQEITNNMLKHSKASTFEINFCKTPHITIVFKDNGIGFSLENLDLSHSNGIQNIKSRAALINFSFNINSQLNKKTMITLVLRQV